MKHNVIGLVNLFTTPNIEPITDSRPLGSTSFLGRYALIDFPLSCFCNSGITELGIMVRDHQRSLLKHVGSLKAWVSNTKIGKQHIMFNEAAVGKEQVNTDINNLRQNDWFLYESSADYIVIMPTHVLASIDLRKVINEHVEKRAECSIVATKVSEPNKDYLGEYILEIDKEKEVVSASINTGNRRKEAIISMGIYVINRKLFGDLVTRYALDNPTLTLTELLYTLGDAKKIRRNVIMFEGYSICISSFKDYMNKSFAMLDVEEAKKLFVPDFPIFTITHDTPPATYSKDASVTSSFISNGAVIEGTVINSIIGRNVRIAKGAVVKNCIVFSGTSVGENAKISNALIDKYAIITRSHSVAGTEDNPIYIKQGAFV